MSQKRVRLLTTIIISVLLCAVFFAGCSNTKQTETQANPVNGAEPVSVLGENGNASGEEELPITYPDEQQAQEPIPVPTPTPPTISEDALTETDHIDYRENEVVVEYYDVGSMANKTETVAAGEDAQVQLVMEVVAQQFFGQPLAETPIKPNSIQLDGDNIFIDFSSSFNDAPLGSNGEVSVLDAIYNGYTQNISGLKNVYFSMDGGDLITGHLDVSKNAPYTP